MRINLLDGSGFIDLKFVVKDVDRHGNIRVYFRQNRRKVRLREALGSAEFIEEYRQALGGGGAKANVPSAPSQSGTLRWLVEQYYMSSAFRTLGPATRRIRRRILDDVCRSKERGIKRFALMKARHVAQIRDEKMDLPEAANARLKVLRALFRWAMLPEVGYADENPTRDVARIRNPSGGHHSWTPDEVRQYWARHHLGTRARLALDVLLFTGARRSDAVTFGRQMVRDGWLNWTESKGIEQIRKDRSIPILAPLQASIEACPSGHLSWLVTAYGKPFTPAGFGNWFRKQCDAADLKHCSAHGVRKAGATIAAENGASTHQLMAIFGWENVQEAERYTKKADRRRMAGEAMHLIAVRAEHER